MSLQGIPVLVTGGNGFVGGRVAAGLAAAGAEVRALVRRPGDHPGLESPRVVQVAGDFVDRETARRACAGMEVVVHAAATLGDSLADARQVNAGGTGGLAAAAREAGCRRFVHISTLSVYDWSRVQGIADETVPLKAGDGPFPHSPAASPFYGLSKADAERALQAEMARGLPATILRLGAVLGLHPTSSWSVLVPDKVRRGEVTVSRDGAGLLPVTHVDNVWHAVELALALPAAIGRAYNIADEEVTMRRYLEEVRSWFPGADSEPRGSEEAEKESFVGRCSGDRIRAELGYRPLRTYREGMDEAAAWWRR